MTQFFLAFPLFHNCKYPSDNVKLVFKVFTCHVDQYHALGKEKGSEGKRLEGQGREAVKGRFKGKEKWEEKVERNGDGHICKISYNHINEWLKKKQNKKKTASIFDS